MKQQIEILPAKAIKIQKKGKYLLILPRISNSKELSDALTKFFGEAVFFVLESKDVNAVKIAELVNTHEEKT